MSGLAYNGPDWIEIIPGRDVRIGDVVSSYETVLLWSPQMRGSRGIKTIVEEPTPEGKIATGSTLRDDAAGRPRRVWTLEDAPPPPVPARIARHQGLIALLLGSGITEQMIRDRLAEIAEPVQREITRIRFEQPDWLRDSDFIAWGAAEFGLSAAQIDDLFRAAGGT